MAFVLALMIASQAHAAEEWLDRVDDALTFSALHDQVRARLSGTLDWEGYALGQPAPALIDAPGHALFTPRLSVFLDAQIGPQLYVFAQTRVDRGFDPENSPLEARLDEYALRFTPWNEGQLNLQVGKFSTFVGNWAQRHGSWSNPFVTAPLPYENLTGVWDAAAVRSSSVLLEWSHLRPSLPRDGEDKYLRLPIIWGPSYATGAAVFGELGRLRYAVEVKQGALSSRPDVWDENDSARWDYPTVSGRLGWQPNPAWTFGVSASSGTYLRPSARPSLVAGHGLGDYRQKVVGQDISFAWRHVQVWSEIYASRFEIPLVGHADSLAYYVEAKYKFTPQFFGAVRWNEQLFADIVHRGESTPWGNETWRIDVAPGYRFTAHTQFKLQYSLQHGGSLQRDFSQLIAAQLTVRF
jgi:hypothetical protein